MLDYFSCMKNYNLIFFKFQISFIDMDYSDSFHWISRSSTQRFYPHCCFWYYVHSLTVQIICCHSPYCYITELSSRLIIFINALDRFLSLQEPRIMVSGLLFKINSFWSCWLNSMLMIEYWRVDLEPL